MSSQQAKLTLRPPPHRQFIQGYPGIPAGQGRVAAHIAGSVEVRLGGKGFKASWLRIELRKIESTTTENWGELIGRGPIEVWSAEGTAEHDHEGNWDLLQTADFPFRIAIPEGLPPTIRLEKQSGISYELVTSLCVKAKKGLIRKDTTSSVIQSTHPIVLEKHELHSTWPIYHIPDDHKEMANDVYARIYRKQTCYAPGDKVEARIILTSKNVSPVKIKTVALSIRETITFRGSKRGSRMLGGVTKTANQKTDMLAQKAQQVGSKIYKGDTKTYDITLVIPKTHSLMTIQTAKHIEISYTMRVYVDTKQPVIIDHLPLTITTVPGSLSAKLVPQIGYVPGLSAPVEYQDPVRLGEQIRRPQSVGPIVSVQRQPADFPLRPGTGNTQPTYRPTPLRSLSFASSGDRSNASTERGGTGVGADLNRRDTVMTTSTASGPGLAGRGVPGGVFSWGQLGAAQPYPAFGTAQSPVRGAFAGPSSIYEGRELAPEENRALYHHSTATHLGEVFEGQSILPEVNVEHLPPRASAPTTMSSVPESEEQHATRVLGPHRPVVTQSSQRSASQDYAETGSVSASQAAEMEKERLYHRAREQAERNQRRVAEVAAASSVGPEGLTSDRNGSGERQPHLSHTVQLQAANNEKQVLYQRARRQAEQYQEQYEIGASFPVEDLAAVNTDVDSSRSTTSISSMSSHGTSAALAATVMSALGSGSRSESPRPIAVGVTGAVGSRQRNPPARTYVSADDEKRKLYEAAMAERDSYLSAQGGSSRRGSSSVMVGSSASSLSQASAAVPMRTFPSDPAVSDYPTAEEEKRRFAAAKAQTDAYLRSTGQSSSHTPVSSSAAPSGRQSLERGNPISYAQSPISVPNSSTRTFPSAEEEKCRLYETAKAEADANQPQAPTQKVSMPVEGPGSSAPDVDTSVGTVGAGAALHTTSTYPSHLSTENEKRMLYERAKANVNRGQAGMQNPSPSRPVTLGPPISVQAEDEKAQLRRFYEAQDAVARHQQGGSSSSAQIVVAAGPAITKPEAAYALGYRSSATKDGNRTAPNGSRSVSPSRITLIPDPYQHARAPPQVPPSYSHPAFLPTSRHSSYSTSDTGSAMSPTATPCDVSSPVTGKQRTLLASTASPSPPLLPALHSNGLKVSQISTSSPSPLSAGGGAPPFRSFRGLSIPTSSFGTSMTGSTGALYAPRIASSDWHEVDDDAGVTGSNSNGPPPPIPPKTPIAGRRAS